MERAVPGWAARSSPPVAVVLSPRADGLARAGGLGKTGRVLTPTSTYRLQITSGQDLHRAAELVPYIRRLGADWVYLSPILRATSGSDHGYDVVDPTEVDPERGGSEGLTALSEAAHAAGLGVVVDIVPNHQGVAAPEQNPWWWDLLAEGRDSRYADAFDVDWAAGGGKVLLPVLGDGDEDLSALTIEDGTLHYYDNFYPLAEGTWREGEDPAEVHGRQHYELVNWRRGDSELNYRRFFTVATLAGVRVEDGEVFDASHTEVSRWFREGLVTGCGSTTRTACGTRRTTWRSSPSSRVGRGPWWRRSSNRGSTSRAAGAPRAPRATTRWAGSTAC